MFGCFYGNVWPFYADSSSLLGEFLRKSLAKWHGRLFFHEGKCAASNILKRTLRENYWQDYTRQVN